MHDRIKTICDEMIGIPYQHNGRDKNGVDCWGVVQLFFNKLNVKLPVNDGDDVADDWYKKDPGRYERGLHTLGEEIGHYENLQQFDIPYFRLYYDVVTHTGVMLNDYQFIHVLINKEVSIGTMKRRFWRRKYAGAIRLSKNYVKGLTLNS